MKMTRTYTQTTRAASAEETRLRILRAASALQTERLTSEISLQDVAARAAVSVQTVLRRFGSRAGLMQETIAFVIAEVSEERRAPVGDVAAAMRVLLDHYELRGDAALLMLAQESAYDHLRVMSDAGKDLHRGWVEGVFAPYLAPLTPAGRDELTDLLVVATDVYTWKLLRRDRGLSRKDTELRMTTLVTALLPAANRERDPR